MAKVWLDSVTFSDSSKIDLDYNDLVIIVGPNNCGKSAALQDIRHLFVIGNGNCKVVKNITERKDGTETELVEHISKFPHVKNTIDGKVYHQGYNFNINLQAAISQWQNTESGLKGLTSVFMNFLSTEERLSLVNPPRSIKINSEQAHHPIHLVQKFDRLENKLSQYFKQAFGTDLIVHRNAGSEVPIYIGPKPIPKEGEDRTSEGYLLELEALDKLHEQGDGMKSFVGLLLNSFLNDYSISLLDEPEAFLHPPQARLLGKMIAKDLSPGRQFFLATHSEDLLKGLLSVDSNSIKILRITRQNNVNNIKLLSGLDVQNLWKDPLLRHSNVLSGLFHDSVIICEGDTDCSFFSAILSAEHENSEALIPDVLFTHCGGKHRIPVAVKALKKMNVKVRVVSDFDILNNTTPLKTIFEDLGGDWEVVKTDWLLIKTQIEQKRKPLLTVELRKQLNSILEEVT